MRVLVLATLLAYARAAPSEAIVAPVAPGIPVVPGIPIVAALPTISPGDLQAAAINAKVLADDKAQEAIDQTRSLIEEAREEIKDKEIVKTDLIKEKTEEQFWNVEDKKWQALDAVKTAEAKLDGSIANAAELIAKSAAGVVVSPYNIAPLTPPIIPSISPLVYAVPNLIAKPGGLGLDKIEQPLIKNAEEKTKDQTKLDNRPLDNLKGETVKLAEPESEKLPPPYPAVGPVLGPLAGVPVGPLAGVPVGPLAGVPGGPLAGVPVGPLVPVAPTKLGLPLFAAPVALSYIPPQVLTPVSKQW